MKTSVIMQKLRTVFKCRTYVVAFLCLIIAQNKATAKNQTSIIAPDTVSTLNDNPTPASTASSRNTFPTHLFTSNNNITILHEVPIAAAVRSDREKPLVLNTHEVLPAKPVKKKPYTLLDKSIISEYEKPRPVKEFDLYPVTFDFNLGDLEDLTHESVKKGDLSTEEKQKHSVHNGDTLKYTGGDDSDAPLDVDVDIAVLTTPKSVSGSSSTIDSKFFPESTTTATASTSTSNFNIELPTVVTISPHIFKILKNKASKKGRELLKKDEMQKGTTGAHHNSINRYFGNEDYSSQDDILAAEGLHVSNLFQILTNLYDHFYWQASDISVKVTTGCGLEMQAYLTALNGNYPWAQKAYDSSGRYRGQLLFGNDKWLGENTFCNELNRQLQPDERKHFEFKFYAALVALRLWLPHKVDMRLQLGECLPKSCTADDVHAILTLDPHAHMLSALSALESSNSTNATDVAQVQVLGVRSVPGEFSYWRELKFQVFASFMFTLILIVLAATWYQAKLQQQQFAMPSIPAISAKLDANGSGSRNGHSNGRQQSLNGKAYELYQMRTLGESDNNGNVVDIETDLNGNKEAEVAAGAGTCSLRRNTNGTTEATGTSKNTLSIAEVEHGTDYKIETGSSAGAAGTYEAKQQLSLNEQILLCFAFQSNAHTILNIDDIKESQTSCVHGLRVLSVLWTIMVHTFLQIFTIGENRFRRVIVERTMLYQIVGNATFSVDTFFFISGFLVTLLYLKHEKQYPQDTGQFVKRSCWDTTLLLIYRYIRLTPAYLFVIFFNDFALRQTLDASVFEPAVPSNTCGQYWWRNILYINNFYPLQEICMIWSWYMANDMQFYIMASLLLVLSTRYFKAAVIVVVTFLLSSWGVSGIISLKYHYTHKVANPFESFDFLYDKPWQRVGTYIMGMLAGYVLYKVKTPPLFIRRMNRLLWTGSLGLLALIIFGVWNGELSMLNTAFYVSVGHTAFGVALIWIALSCCWGLAPTVNRVLSYRALWPLSRLTYCTYLIHPVIMLLISFRMGGTVHLNNLFILTIFLGNAVVSFGVAFFISVIFEAPVIRILKICFKK